jgi:hypothetical protein
VSLEIDLVVDVTTPADNPFITRSLAEQQTIVNQLQLTFNVAPWITTATTTGILDTWKSIPNITLDLNYQETASPSPAPTSQFVRTRFVVANGQLTAAGSGYTIDVGALTQASPCSKMPDCSHNCQHTFEVNRIDSSGTQKPWKVTWDGVVATVTVVAWWTTPATVHI